jgi:hypothetical protein
VVGLAEGTVEDLLAAADRVEAAAKLEAVRGLAVAATRGLRAAGVEAVGGVGFRVEWVAEGVAVRTSLVGDLVGEGRAEAALAVSRVGGGRLMLVGRLTGGWLTMLLTPAARKNMPWFVSQSK